MSMDQVGQESVVWSSDLAADVLTRFGVDCVSFTAGSTFRGLLESLGTRAEERRPRLIPALHEEHAISIAHGYAKATGRPMAVLIHSNVGLMHASMAIYNAYCDQVPMLIIGATGPLDAAARRPWIDWIHTSTDQNALVRDFTKWDALATSPLAICEAIAQGHLYATTAPAGPVYVCVDQPAFEVPLAASGAVDPVVTAVAAMRPPEVDVVSGSVPAASTLLAQAERPLLLIGRVMTNEDAWNDRVALAERFGMAVVADLRAGAGFPTDHPLYVGAKRLRGVDEGVVDAVRRADVILSLAGVDREGFVGADPRPGQRIIEVAAEYSRGGGRSQDFGRFVGPDMIVNMSPDAAVAAILRSAGADGGAAEPTGWWTRTAAGDRPAAEPEEFRALARALRSKATSTPLSIARLPIGWDTREMDFTDPWSYLGFDGGGGLGSGPGMVVGAAVGMQTASARHVCVGIIGDGDLLMGMNALWSASTARVGVVLIVVNNRAYGHESAHTVEIQRIRRRTNPLADVGHHFEDPALDLGALAAAQGWVALEAAGDDDLEKIVGEAVDMAQEGRPVLVDYQVF